MPENKDYQDILERVRDRLGWDPYPNTWTALELPDVSGQRASLTDLQAVCDAGMKDYLQAYTAILSEMDMRKIRPYIDSYVMNHRDEFEQEYGDYYGCEDDPYDLASEFIAAALHEVMDFTKAQMLFEFILKPMAKAAVSGEDSPVDGFDFALTDPKTSRLYLFQMEKETTWYETAYNRGMTACRRAEQYSRQDLEEGQEAVAVVAYTDDIHFTDRPCEPIHKEFPVVKGNWFWKWATGLDRFLYAVLPGMISASKDLHKDLQKEFATAHDWLLDVLITEYTERLIDDEGGNEKLDFDRFTFNWMEDLIEAGGC